MKNKNLPWGEYGYFLELHSVDNQSLIQTTPIFDISDSWQSVDLFGGLF